MSRSFLRQDTQIKSSDVFDDTLAAGSGLEDTASNLQNDLNGLRSQMKRAIGVGDWFSDIGTVNSKQRDIFDLNTDLDELESQLLIFGVQVLTNITVPASQNYVVLVQASAETPTQVASVSSPQEGAVVAVLAGDVGAHALTEIAGANALSPKNLVIIRDASTKDVITSGGQEIFALIQAETGVVNGDTFNDTTKQVQLSFVKNSGDDLIAVPVADIENKVIEYMYPRRIMLDNLPEDMAWPPHFIDQVAPVDVTLDNAIDAQGTTPATQATDIFVRITDTKSWNFADPTGASNILKIAAASGADEVEFNVDVFDVNNSATADFSNGVMVDSAGSPINLGVTANQIDNSAGAFNIQGATDLKLDAAGGELKFDDSYRDSSTWSIPLSLADSAAEWSSAETYFGEVSLLNMLNQLAPALAADNMTKADYVISVDIAADSDFIPGTNATLLNGVNPDLSNVTFLTDLLVFVNGQLMIPGANAAANNDYYPGTTLSSSHLKFEFGLKSTPGNPDHLTICKFKTVV